MLRQGRIKEWLKGKENKIMSMFWDTMAGQRFTQDTMPELVNAVNRLAAAIEKSNEIALNGKEVIASAEKSDGRE